MALVGAAEGGVRLIESGPLFEVWVAPDGAKTRLDWNRRGGVRMSVTGHGHADFSFPTIRRWEEATRSGSRPVVLIDFWDMPTYDSSMRWQMTPFGVKHRHDIDFHVLSRSRPVLIGLGVANVAMGGLMAIHEKRPNFDAVCATHGLVTK